MSARRLLAPLLLTLVWACDGEPIDLPFGDDATAGAAGGGSGGVGGGGSGGEAGGGQGGSGGSGGSGGAGSSEWPSAGVLDAFAPTIAVLLDAHCASCHGGAPTPRDGLFAFDPQDPGALSADDRLTWFEEIEEFCDWGNGEASPLVTLARGLGHIPIWPAQSQEDAALVAFIDGHRPPPPVEPDMGVVEPDAGPPPPDQGLGPQPGVPCDGLTGSDPLDRPGFYEAFAADVDSMLQQSCGQSVCHGQPGNGGRYWVAVESGCATEWNFAHALTFIDYRDPAASPLSEEPVSPNHGGREVFSGRNDPRFILLNNWILSGTTR